VPAADALTGLANKRACHDTPQVDDRSCGACGLAASVIVVDLDHFKQVHDRYRHGAG